MKVYMVRRIDFAGYSSIYGIFTKKEKADEIAEKVAGEHYCKMRFDVADETWTDSYGDCVAVIPFTLDENFLGV